MSSSDILPRDPDSIAAERRGETAPASEGAPVAKGALVDEGARQGEGIGLAGWLTVTDHKRIGTLYVVTALVFFLVAVAFAMLMRTQLIRPNNDFLSPNQYNQIFTMHGTTMVFLFAMPILAGLANYLVPLMIGARDMAFPRLNALSYWLFLAGGLMLYASFAFGGAPNTGWFSYAPLTSRVYSGFDGIDFWIFSILLVGTSSILGAINMIVSMRRLRAPGMKIGSMPIFAYATYVNSYLILFAIPSLTVAVSLLYLDRHYGTTFFETTRGGDAVLWQHLFWFFGHPEVYILILPAFGILSEVVPVFARKPLFGRFTMQAMLWVIGAIGFFVWAHHMFAVGEHPVLDAFFSGATMVIAVPTGVKIFNWIATMWEGTLRFSTALLFCLGFMALFTVGGLSGVTLAVVPFDWQVTDTYYVVAHFHNVLFAGTLFAVFAGIYYWFPKVTGRRLSERIGRLNFVLLLVGFSLAFMPLYVVGVLGMPRRVFTYGSGLGWNTGNLVSSIGGYVIAAGVIVFLFNLLRSSRKGEPAGNDPWDAWTLEWLTESPPPHFNFAAIPIVGSARPLWDIKHPERADWRLAREGVAHGTEARPLKAEAPGPPSAAPAIEIGVGELELEGRSSLPVLIALGAIVFLAGGLGSKLISVLGVMFILGTLTAWVWETRGGESIQDQPEAAAGEEVLPARPPAALGTLLFIASETIFFAALIASYLDLRLRQAVWPPEGMPTLSVGLPLVNTLVLVASGILIHLAIVGLRNRRTRLFQGLVIGTLVLGAAFLGGQAYEYTHVGFGLGDGLMGATFFTLTGFHGAHVAAGLIVLGLALARSLAPASGRDENDSPQETEEGAGAKTSRVRALAQSGAYYWHFVDAVWVVLFVVLYLLPTTR